MGPVEQQLHRLPPSRAVIHGPLVHVHTHECIGPLVADPAIELPGVSQGRCSVFQRVDDAGTQIPGYLSDDVGAQVATNRVASER
jgi:hypothetical protein